MLEQVEPDRRHPGGVADALGLDQIIEAFAIQFRPGQDQLRPDQRRVVGLAPGVDVEHGHDRHHGFAGERAGHGRRARHQRVQHGRPVRVQRALGVARGPGGVAQRRGCVFVEFGPLHLAVEGADEVLVNHGVQRGVWQVFRRTQNDNLFQLGAVVDDLLDQGQEHRIDHDDPVFGMVDDVDQLLGEQARVDGVADRTNPRNTVVNLQMAMVVPRQRCHAVGHADSGIAQRLRQLFGPLVDIAVGMAHHAFARDHGHHF